MSRALVVLIAVTALGGCLVPSPNDATRAPSGQGLNAPPTSPEIPGPGRDIPISDSAAPGGTPPESATHPQGTGTGTTQATRPKPPPSPTRDLPLLLIHGLDALGPAGHDYGHWANMREALADWGWKRQFTVGYYECDASVDVWATDDGRHDAHIRGREDHAGSSCGVRAHDADTSIEHVAYHVAWAIHDRFTSEGTCVNVMAHSMGGLITRFALAASAARTADFPPALCVAHVVTLGTPHAGADLAGYCPGRYQCNQLDPGSPFLRELSRDADNPQGHGGTRWILVASAADAVVPVSSAVAMRASSHVVFAEANHVHHSNPCNYMHATCSGDDAGFSRYVIHTADARTADVTYASAGVSLRSKTAPWPVRWADLAMATNDFSWAPHSPNAPPTLVDPRPAEDVLKGPVGASATFEVTSEDRDGEIVETRFFLDDRLQWTKSCIVNCGWDRASWSHTFDNPGRWKVVARVVDDEGATVERTWTVIVEALQKDDAPERTVVERGRELALAAQAFERRTFQLDRVAIVDYEFEVLDTSQIDVGIIRDSDGWRYQQGEAVATPSYYEDRQSAADRVQLEAGIWALVFHCDNTWFDCDLRYSLSFE